VSDHSVRVAACHVLGRLAEHISRAHIDDALGISGGGPHTDLAEACRGLLDALDIRVVRGADDFLEFRERQPCAPVML
jgi:hypothetical protein